MKMPNYYRLSEDERSVLDQIYGTCDSDKERHARDGFIIWYSFQEFFAALRSCDDEVSEQEATREWNRLDTAWLRGELVSVEFLC